MSSPEIEWRRLRADQLRDMARQDAMVILPLGSIEQHGPHLPVEVDSRLGEEVALRTARVLAERGQKVLVLPMLWPGVSEHHMSFGGTITLGYATYHAVIEDICRSVLRHGFRRIVLLNGHGMPSASPEDHSKRLMDKKFLLLFSKRSACSFLKKRTKKLLSAWLPAYPCAIRCVVSDGANSFAVHDFDICMT